jgi:hypothetical protein
MPAGQRQPTWRARTQLAATSFARDIAWREVQRTLVQRERPRIKRPSRPSLIAPNGRAGLPQARDRDAPSKVMRRLETLTREDMQASHFALSHAA